MIIRNGQVFDSVNAKFEKKDIGIHQGVFVALDEDTQSNNEVDAEGNYVVPGIIDEHAHLNLYGTIIGANADTVCIPNGITTACDGGTCGASNFEQFYMSNIIRYESTVYSYLNVSTFGNKSLCKHEEDHDPADFREDLIDSLFEKLRSHIRSLPPSVHDDRRHVPRLLPDSHWDGNDIQSHPVLRSQSGKDLLLYFSFPSHRYGQDVLSLYILNSSELLQSSRLYKILHIQVPDALQYPQQMQ